MTETVTPSVEGKRRFQVSVVLVVAATVTGAAAGLVSGLGWSAAGLPKLGTVAAAVVVALAVAADALSRVTGRPAPLSVQKQVPRIWGRIFDLRTAALLYGARLGVGPLTILATWLWWAAALVGASLGPWTAAAVGGTFGSTRMLTVLVASDRVREAMPQRMARLRERERLFGSVLGASGVAGALLALSLA